MEDYEEAALPYLIAYEDLDAIELRYNNGRLNLDRELCYHQNGTNERINFSPLLLATMGDKQAVIEKLIDLGARINQVIYDTALQNKLGSSPQFLI